MGTMGGEDVQFFMATSFVLKRRAAGWERVFLFSFFLSFFFPRIYVYTLRVTFLSFHKRRMEETE